MVVHNLAVDALRHHDVLRVDSLERLRLYRIDKRVMERVNKAEWSERLTDLLARLQKEQPENCWLVCQRYLEGRKPRELAEETGLLAHVVSYRISRAMQKLRSWASESFADEDADF